MHTVERLKLAALIAAMLLLAYGIRAESETARLAAIGVLVVGLVLRFVRARKPDEAKSARDDA